MTFFVVAFITSVFNAEEVQAKECICKIEDRSRTVTLDYSLGSCSRLNGSKLVVGGTEVKVYDCKDSTSGAKSK